MLKYKEKYIKYKNKYNLLKQNIKLTKNNNLVGGTNLEIADVDENIVSIELNKKNINLGQHNCGIVFIEDYAVKCIGKYENITENNARDDLKEHAEKINEELSDLFPKYYAWKNGRFENYIKLDNSDEYAKCIIMERLNGDLTNYIINNSYVEAYGNLDNYDFFYERLPKTMIQYISDYIEKNDLDEIKQQKKINNDKWKEMIENVKRYIFECCYSLNIDVIFLHHELLKKGWKYIDLKLDNLGYKNENNKLKIYFIDEESGLVNIKNNNAQYNADSEPNFDEYLNLHFVNTHLGCY